VDQPLPPLLLQLLRQLHEMTEGDDAASAVSRCKNTASSAGGVAPCRSTSRKRLCLDLGLTVRQFLHFSAVRYAPQEGNYRQLNRDKSFARRETWNVPLGRPLRCPRSVKAAIPVQKF
jgi:hypothetical protein